jgi:hypothetical protein
MSTRRHALITAAAALIAALTLACDDPDSASEDIDFRGGAGQGGPLFNTPKIFTSEVAAVDTTGLALAGVTLVGVDVYVGGVLTPITAGSLDVDHGTLTAQAGAVVVEGTDFIDSLWTFQVNGVNLLAQLNTVETADAAGLYDPLLMSQIRLLDPERLVYRFTYTDDKKNVIDTCQADAIGGARMVIYGDILVDHKRGKISSRANTVYFGCISGAVGKAALWGYAPDSPSLSSIPLPAFQTAVRTVRADYCGDGKAHTKVGNAVALRDRWLINEFVALPFTTEAVWKSGGGAVCLSRIRETGVTLAAPHVCPDGHVIPLCGADAVVENSWAAGTGQFWSKIP